VAVVQGGLAQGVGGARQGASTLATSPAITAYMSG
jgi:hypothetical protein